MADYKFTQSASELQALANSIGTDDLTTTAQTLTGAVNELDTEVGSNASAISTLQGNVTTLQGQGIKYFTSQVVSVASSAEIMRITDSSITTNTYCRIALALIRSGVTPTYKAGAITNALKSWNGQNFSSVEWDVSALTGDAYLTIMGCTSSSYNSATITVSNVIVSR